MSSSSSSTPKPKMLRSLVVAMEESKEKETRNTNLTLGSPQEVTSERRVEIHSFRSGSAVQRGSDIMEFNPPKSNKIYSCQFCMKEFSNPHALGGHQNAHKQEREWDKKRKEMEGDFPGFAFLNSYLDKPHILLGGYSREVLSNENHLGITLEPFKRLGYPCFNSVDTGGIGGMNMALVPRLNTSPFPSSNHMYPLIQRNAFPFPPPRTSRYLAPQENILIEQNFISKIGINNVVENDDDGDDEDQPEEGTFKSGGIDLSLSL